jgi:hypothetical protein
MGRSRRHYLYRADGDGMLNDDDDETEDIDNSPM